MTKLIVNAIQVLGEDIRDGVVSLSSSDIQYSDGRMVLPEFQREKLVNGQAVFNNVAPGKAIVQFAWDHNRTATVRASVPDTDSITLASLTLQQYDQDPAIVSQVTKAVTDIESSLVELRGLRTSASESATQASKAEDGAGASEKAAKTSETNSKTSETNAKASEKESTAQAELSGDAAALAIVAAAALERHVAERDPTDDDKALKGSVWVAPDQVWIRGESAWYPISANIPRSHRILVHDGTGDPDLSDFPDAQIGDLIERTADGARWKVEE